MLYDLHRSPAALRIAAFVFCVAGLVLESMAQSGTTSPGMLYAPGNVNPNITSQGAYLGWNALTSGAGETDLITNQGGGQGGFAFFNAPPDGSVKNLLVYLTGDGNLSLGGFRNNTLTGDSRLAFPAYRDVVYGNMLGASISSERKNVFGNNAVILTDLLLSTTGYDEALNADRANPQTLQERMRITHEGQIGINTSSPGEMLEVNGNIKITSNSGAHIVFSDSTVQSTAWTGVLSGGDYAESVEVNSPQSSFEPGDVLVIDPEHHGHFLKSSKAYSVRVGGVYASHPGVVGRREPKEKSREDEIPMAMVGIVPTKVSTENGPIHDGDLLVSSSTPGYAMKGTDRSLLTGAVIGKALGSVEVGTGIVEVLISLQ